ncbi:MAG: PRD domain-containing protein [Candidatus Methanomethylicaceae archaeon]
MEIKKRHLEVLYYLLEQNYPLSLSHISKELGYSFNTLKKDLTFLESILSKNNLKLIKKPKVGIKIFGDINDIEKFKYNLKQNILFSQDKTERFYITAFSFLLMEPPPTIEKLSELLETSSVSATNYIKKIKEYFKTKNINIIGYPRRGYKIVADEKIIRDEIFNLLSDYASNDFIRLWKDLIEKNTILTKLLDLDILKLSKIIENYEEDKNIKFEDIDFIKIVIKIAISLNRIKLGKIITSPPKIKQKIPFTNMELIKKIEEEFDLKIPKEERIYILKPILDYEKIEKEDIDKIKILNILKNYIAIDNYNFYYLEMLVNHIKRAIKKTKLKVKIENPLLESVKNIYNKEFEKAIKIAQDIDKEFKIKICEAEIGYITLYLKIIEENIFKRKKVILVCPMGIATSNILYWNLKKEFPNIEIVGVYSYKEFLKKHQNINVDLIISTSPLPLSTIPYIVVSPLLTKKEKEMLNKIIGD